MGFKEPVELSDCVIVDVSDKQHPICIEVDGWIELAEAKKILADLQKAIEIAER